MIWPIVNGRGVSVPSMGRLAVVPLTGNRPPLGQPPYFDPLDPSDVDVMAWDWSYIAYSGEAIVAAAITCDPPVVTISTPILFGLVVQAFIGPVTGANETIDLNCAVTFTSGRVLDWGVEVTVLPL